MIVRREGKHNVNRGHGGGRSAAQETSTNLPKANPPNLEKWATLVDDAGRYLLLC